MRILLNLKSMFFLFQVQVHRYFQKKSTSIVLERIKSQNFKTSLSELSYSVLCDYFLRNLIIRYWLWVDRKKFIRIYKFILFFLFFIGKLCMHLVGIEPETLTSIPLLWEDYVLFDLEFIGFSSS